MRAVIQRVVRGAVRIDGVETASIGRGMVVLLGVKRGDTIEQAHHLARRTANQRIFDDANGVPNISVIDTAGDVLVVSQFTLYADTRKGNRPSYIDAAPPEEAQPLYEAYVAALREHLPPGKIRTGVFRAMMEVTIVNDGPFTIIVNADL
jgi:D-tyrosyl-tRNA(Tyr) deacylase